MNVSSEVIMLGMLTILIIMALIMMLIEALAKRAILKGQEIIMAMIEGKQTEEEAIVAGQRTINWITADEEAC